MNIVERLPNLPKVSHLNYLNCHRYKSILELELTIVVSNFIVSLIISRLFIILGFFCLQIDDFRHAAVTLFRKTKEPLPEEVRYFFLQIHYA